MLEEVVAGKAMSPKLTSLERANSLSELVGSSTIVGGEVLSCMLINSANFSSQLT